MKDDTRVWLVNPPDDAGFQILTAAIIVAAALASIAKEIGTLTVAVKELTAVEAAHHG